MKLRLSPNHILPFCLALGFVCWPWTDKGSSSSAAMWREAVAGPATRPLSDRFGGARERVGRPANFFRVKKINNRWLFLTPAGDPYWMMGVFAVDTTGSTDDLGSTYENRIMRKYGDKTTWGEQTVRRLKAWGFNTLAEYSTWYVLPTKSPYGNWSNPEKMPFVTMTRPSYYGLRNRWDYAREPFKDLVAGTDPAVYGGWRAATLPDVFDPNFEAYADGLAKAMQKEVTVSPWLIGAATDDTDDLFGFGPGPEVKTGHLHPHIGWLVLVTNFQQKTNQNLGITYSDPTVYSKYALRDFLRARYGSIKALNAAWDSSYTTWDSAGGWPSGSGFLDESGRHRWVGRDFGELGGMSPAARSDLDGFLYDFAQRYFYVTSKAIRKYVPNHLVFGPASLNGWGGLTRPQILSAAGKYLDVVQADIGNERVLELTARYIGDLPIVNWVGMVANPDSSLWRYPNPPEGVPGFKTQEIRGQAYAQRVHFLWQAKTASGVYPIAGLKLWAFADSWGEKANWGLVTFSDNAYDGTESAKATGRDRWGFPTGGEEQNYGDFLSVVQRVNGEILRSLNDEAQSAAELRSGGAQSTSKN